MVVSFILLCPIEKYHEPFIKQGKGEWALWKISAHKVDYLSALHSQLVDREVSTQQSAAIMI